MIIEALFLGLVLGFLYYELVGISPGGVIAPGYIALFVRQPNKIAATIFIALLVLYLIRFLSQHLILYGRRKLLLAILLGFCIKVAVELWIQPLPMINIDLQSIGYIIPGLIANELSRQKVVPTLLSLGVVSTMVYLILLIL